MSSQIEIDLSDRNLLTGCFGKQNGSNDKGRIEFWNVVRKSGAILMLARAERKGLLQERSYRALKLKGRLYRQALKAVSRTFFWRCLPKIQITPSEACLINSLEEKFDGRVCAILFGNPVQKHRRAMIQLYLKDGKLIVIKAGFGEDAARSVHREVNFLGNCDLPQRITPLLLDSSVTKSLAWLALAWVEDGNEVLKPSQCDKAAVHFLHGLRIPKSTMLLSEWPEWETISCAHKVPEHLMERRLMGTLAHGDFAAWNLIIKTDRLIALDWEWGQLRGVSGLDLVHLYYQDAAMIHEMRGQRLIDKLIESLNHDLNRCFLLDCGWFCVEEALVVYLATLNPIFLNVEPKTFARLVNKLEIGSLKSG